MNDETFSITDSDRGELDLTSSGVTRLRTLFEDAAMNMGSQLAESIEFCDEVRNTVSDLCLKGTESFEHLIDSQLVNKIVFASLV